jgi:CO dehydrogenase maturation factor
MAETRTLALCGKGGVGKTSIAALMVKLLGRENGRKVLAIDADPAVGLASALGIMVSKTVDDIRKDLIRTLKDGERPDSRDTLHMLDYEIFDALAQGSGFSLLAIGRPEDEGCFCRVNSLLKDIIESLSSGFDVVLIDGEAGVEQINRRVMKTVDHLFLISDTSAKGVNVASAIAHVARDNKAVGFKDMGLILNRVRSKDEVDDIRARTSLDLYGWMGEDWLIREYDFRGIPLTEIPDTSPAIGVVRDILEKIVILSG